MRVPWYRSKFRSPIGVGALATALALGWLMLPAVATAAEQPNPYVQRDASWITLKGEVKSAGTDTFVLDYGSGEIVVEMDDGDRLGDAYKLMPGDEVTVSGRIDDDFFASTSIEASSVYVENLGETFFANPVDDEQIADLRSLTALAPEDDYHLIGTVSGVGETGFTIDTGGRQLRVDVDQLGYDPLDDEGFMKIEKGDRVSVSGKLETDPLQGRELDAGEIIELTYPREG